MSTLEEIFSGVKPEKQRPSLDEIFFPSLDTQSTSVSSTPTSTTQPEPAENPFSSMIKRIGKRGVDRFKHIFSLPEVDPAQLEGAITEARGGVSRTPEEIAVMPPENFGHEFGIAMEIAGFGPLAELSGSAGAIATAGRAANVSRAVKPVQKLSPKRVPPSDVFQRAADTEGLVIKSTVDPDIIPAPGRAKDLSPGKVEAKPRESRLEEIFEVKPKQAEAFPAEDVTTQVGQTPIIAREPQPGEFFGKLDVSQQKQIPFIPKKYLNYEAETGSKSLARAIYEEGGLKQHQKGTAGRISEEVLGIDQKFIFRKEGHTADELVSLVQERGFSQIKSENDLISELALESDFVNRSTESELALEVDRAIGEVAPPVGLSIRKAGKPVSDKLEGVVEFADPAVEARFKKAKGGFVGPTLRNRVNAKIEIMLNKTTRGAFEHIPRGAEHAELRVNLSRLKKQRNVSQDRTARIIQGITHKFGPKKMDLFTRKVILDDLAVEVREGRDVPFGLTKESVQAEHSKISDLVTLNKDVAESVVARKKIWDAMRNDYTKAMEDIGMDVGGRFSNPNYFRHQVLEHANMKTIKGTGGRLKTPVGRDFLKKRKGSDFDINANYLEAEFEVMAQMSYDIEVAKVINFVDKKYNIKGTLKEGEAVPDTHTEWQPREGSSFFLADSIPSKIATQMHEGVMENYNISKVDLSKILAVGGKRRQLVIPTEVANQLENLTPAISDNPVAIASRSALKSWKVWQLISPRRFFKYNARNLTGDADGAFAGNHAGFAELPSSIKELYPAFFSNKSLHPEVQQWFNRGGFETSLRAQEIGDVNDFRIMENLKSRADKASNLRPDTLAVKAFNGYWKTARLTTDYREAMLRYANYKSYIKQIEKNRGKPNNYGASLREEIDAIPDPRDKAFQLSNELLGAYDDISMAGQVTRRQLIPFWSWKEVNLKRYARLFNNAKIDGKMSAQILKTAGVSAPLAATRGGIKMAKFMLKASALWAGLQVWNNTKFPEEEAELDDFQRNRAHIILGRDEDGKVKSFNNVGALGDFLAWFGLDMAPRLVDDWFRGKRTATEIAKEMSKSPVNTVAQGLSPVLKLPAEIISRHTFYPDVFNPHIIRDRKHYLFRSVALGDEYAALTGKPSKGYQDSLKDLFYYRIDPGQGSYRDIMSEKSRFLKNKGKVSVGFFETPRGNALYNLKMSVRFNDIELQNKFILQYMSMGGTLPDLLSSLKSMHPLSGLNKSEKLEFVAGLDTDDQRRLKNAVKFYDTVLLTGKNELQLKENP